MQFDTEKKAATKWFKGTRQKQSHRSAGRRIKSASSVICRRRIPIQHIKESSKFFVSIYKVQHGRVHRVTEGAQNKNWRVQIFL